MDIDHLFIRVEPGGPEGEALRAFGLAEGSGNRHPGQGTANRRFFFRNAYIELLWLDDVQQARSELTAPTMLFERLANADPAISPFGVCFRPSVPDEARPSFPSWRYTPTYLPPGLAIDIGVGDLPEPMIFFLSFASRPDAQPVKPRQPMTHRHGLRELTTVRITAPTCDGPCSLAAAAAGVEIVSGQFHLMELGFDNETQAQVHDFRPQLPLVLRW
jgi:hypothetical protein